MKEREEVVEYVAEIAQESDWKERITKLFSDLEERELLEALGSGVDADMFLAIVDILPPSEHHHPKLSPVMVGLPPKTFLEVLIKATELQLTTLRHEAVAEPLQHQLTLLYHTMSQNETAFTKELQSLKEQVATFDVTALTKKELDELYNNLHKVSGTIDSALHKIDLALALAWNTDRPDLVDSFTELKEYYLNDLRIGLGHPQGEKRAPSGLYATLEQHLEDLFADVDGEPATEALAKLSIWYVKDFAALGLLPHLTDEERAIIESAEDIESEKREQLRTKALATLSKMGLNSVEDFRREKIYSKAMLQEFLRR